MVLTLAGCASGQPTKPAEPAATPAPASTPELGIPLTLADWSTLGYRLDWVGFPFPRQSRSARVKFLAPYEDIVVAQESDSTITVLEASTGKRRWSSELTGPLTRFVGVLRDPNDSGRIYACSESEAFILSVANGNLLGRQKFERVVNTHAVPVGDTLVFGTSTSDVYAHSITINDRAWGFISDGIFEGAPVAIGDFLCAVSQAGDVVFLSATGKLVGRNRIFGGVSTNPVSNGSLVFIASLDQSLWAFDPLGNSSWRYRTSTPLRVQPTALEDRVYCELKREGLTAFDAASGTILWQSKDARGVVIGMRSGRLLAWNQGELFSIDPANGDIVSCIKTPGIVNVEAASFTDGVLYVTSDKGVIAKFSPR
jgi:outer membrane protein assembly factor BamB